MSAARVDERVWTLMDLTASYLQLGGARPSGDRVLDGHPVLVDVIDNRETPARDFFWRARRGDRTWRAVRSGPLKFLSREDAGVRQEWLFNLQDDPGEKTDLLASQGAAASRLRALLAAWERDVRPER
jgi:N-acetylgalactosamine-6-sulfatase